MIKNNNSQEPTNLVVVPAQLVDEIKQLINELQSQKNVTVENGSVLGEFISEKDAKVLLDRKTTWFYEQRRSGRLLYSKVGSKVYYKKNDLFKLLNGK
jgi:hypothetical protein